MEMEQKIADFLRQGWRLKELYRTDNVWRATMHEESPTEATQGHTSNEPQAGAGGEVIQFPSPGVSGSEEDV